ncbi:hypothetical protein KSD_35480 [Ktedonobacter sp. SOSP1-85]|uniref:hypothetical protein n=1 Tax=Ktedonobacter sp. SOSP1-85 TaxID=2778367 RepID=UPI001915AA67|nr:hypothetical protein [Ktedonobacter sp. SOSP1-85]GHO75777.1 hypothetical protein KSD_35480 [Ktedonobacter sp. SOSP1-85]
MRKRSLLARLRTNGFYYLVSSLLLLVAIPLYQVLVLNPTGFSDTRTMGHLNDYLFWLGNHTPLFVIYRGLLAIAFAILFTMPYTLYRIIVAQEILGRSPDEESIAEAEIELEENEELEELAEEEAEANEIEPEEEATEENTMPEFAWRGKGFAIIAVWTGTAGIALFVLGTVLGTIYLLNASHGFMQTGETPANIGTFDAIFTITTNTISIGLIAISSMFFGAMIARAGKRLWPGNWLWFSYMALAVAALLSGSAVGVASAPSTGQATLTTFAILLFGIWNLWHSIMLLRLKAE